MENHNFIHDLWTRKEYHELIDYIKDISTKEYKSFSESLTPGSIEILGVRTPALRHIAKEVARGNVYSYFDVCQYRYHEEIMLKEMVIGYSKIPFDDILSVLDEHLPHVSNWALCDCLAMDLKVFKKNMDKGYEYIRKLKDDPHSYKVRFMLIVMLSYYLEDRYIDDIFSIVEEIREYEYYVRMGIAWLIATAYAKNKEKTKQYLLRTELDAWTFNKAIQKSIESYRISDDDKIFLRSLKKKIS